MKEGYYGKRGILSASYGIPLSEETKEKIRQKLLGRVMSEESRLKMIATKLAKRGAV